MSRHEVSSTNEPPRRIADQAEPANSTMLPLRPQQLERWAEAVACGDISLQLGDLQAHPELLAAIRTKRRARLVVFLAKAIAADICSERRRQKEARSDSDEF